MAGGWKGGGGLVRVGVDNWIEVGRRIGGKGGECHTSKWSSSRPRRLKSKCR